MKQCVGKWKIICLSPRDAISLLQCYCIFHYARLGSHVRLLLLLLQEASIMVSGSSQWKTVHRGDTGSESERHLGDIQPCLPASSWHPSPVDSGTSISNDCRTCIDLIYLSLSTAFHYTKYTLSPVHCIKVPGKEANVGAIFLSLLMVPLLAALFSPSQGKGSHDSSSQLIRLIQPSQLNAYPRLNSGRRMKV